MREYAREQAREPTVSCFASEWDGLCGKDAVLFLINRFCRGGRYWKAGAAAVVLNTLLASIPGFLISAWIEKRGINALLIYDRREFSLFLFTMYVFPFCIWTLFAWQADGFKKAVARADEQGAFRLRRDAVRPSAASTRLTDRYIYDPRLLHAVSIFIATAGSLAWLFAELDSSNPFLYGKSVVWYMTNPYMGGLYQLLCFLSGYALALITARQFIAAVFMRDMFRNYEVAPRVFHPDGVNGLSSVGQYILTVKSTLILCVLWLLAITLYPMLFGWGQPVIKGDTMFFIALFILIGVLVSLLTKEMHAAMVKARDKMLGEIAGSMQVLLDAHSPDAVLANEKLFAELRGRYELLQSHLKTWPFRMIAVGRYLLPALLGSSLLPQIFSFIANRIFGS